MTGIDIIGVVRTAESAAASETTAGAQAGQAPDVYARVSSDQSESGFTRALSEARAAEPERAAEAAPETTPAAETAPESDGDGSDEQTEQTELIDMSVLAALFAARPLTAPEPDAISKDTDAFSETAIRGETAIQPQEQAESSSSAQELVNILEGTAIDGTENTSYSSVSARVDTAKTAEAAEMTAAREEQARMPQARMRTGTQEQIPEERDAAPADIRDDAPCPLENVNEETEPTVLRTDGKREPQSDAEPRRDDGGEDLSYTPPAGTPVDVAPEKVSAAEQMKTAPAQQLPATRENLFDTMVERLEVMREDGVSTMSVELKPEYLGRVTLDLSMTDGGVSVRISASDPDVKGMIDGQIAALIENLSGKGVKIDRVDVVYAGVSSGEYDAFGANSKSNGGERGSRRRNRGGVTAGVPAQLAAYAPELMWASVGDEDANAFEYSA